MLQSIIGKIQSIYVWIYSSKGISVNIFYEVVIKYNIVDSFGAVKESVWYFGDSVVAEIYISDFAFFKK